MTDPTMIAYTQPVQAGGAPTLPASPRPSLREARAKAEERRRLAIGTHTLPLMSKELGFPVEVQFRRMTLQEVVTTGNVPDELREYADILMGAMTRAAFSGRGGKDPAKATEEGVGKAAMDVVQEELGAIEFLERQKMSVRYTVMFASIDPMIVESYDADVYTDPDNMLVIDDIPEQDLTGLYAAISRNEKGAVLTDLKSVPADDAVPDEPEDTEGAPADSTPVVHAPKASRVPAYPSGD